jgi:hypothetical protein
MNGTDKFFCPTTGHSGADWHTWRTWQPIFPAYSVGEKYAICSGRGTKAICECGEKFNNHKINYDNQDEPLCPASFARFEGVKIADGIPTQTIEYAERYVPLTCELVSVMDEEEWHSNLLRTLATKYGASAALAKALTEELDAENRREGFDHYPQCDEWIEKFYGDSPKLWRYEFKR